MSKKLNDLRHQRSVLVTQARGLLNKAEQEKRNLTTEEQQQYDKMFTDQDALRKAIENEERLIEAERSIAEKKLREADPDPTKKEDRKGPRASEEYRDAFGALLRGGMQALNPDQVRASAGAGSEGGFIILPNRPLC